MKVFEVIRFEIIDCVSSIESRLFDTKEKAVNCFNITWKSDKSELCGVSNQSDDEFLKIMREDEGWEGTIDIDNYKVDIYEDGYAAHNSYSLQINEKEVE